MTGTFFFVVGPSGAGKDTLIDGARRALAGQPYVFARRVITRPAGSAGEDHDAESPQGFARRKAAGEFLVTWQAHGLDYGLPASLLDRLAEGRHVVANGSRAIVIALAGRLPSLVVVEVCAPAEVLAQRIAGRGRESAEQVLARLTRQVDPMPPGVLRQRVVNDGDPAQGIARFVQALRHPLATRVARSLPLDTGDDVVVVAPPMSLPASTRLRLQGMAGTLADVHVHAQTRADAASALPHDALGLPAGLMQSLGLENGQAIRLLPTLEAGSRRLLTRKLRGGALTASDYEAVFWDALDGRYTPAELTAFLVATTRALDADETLALARARTRLAPRIAWDAPQVVDKHSLGGVPGNRMTLIVVPIAAAHGLVMPKASSRAITSASGTADAMAVLARVALDAAAIRRCVQQAGACIAWNGRINHNVIDEVMNRITRPLELDTGAWSVASILSKKVTAGVTHLVIDVPYGPRTKQVDAAQAQALCALFERVGHGLGLQVRALPTDGTRPIGRGIGPALEVRDVQQVLRNDPDAPQDLRAKSLTFAAHLLAWDPAVGSFENGLRRATELLESGAANAALARIVDAQGAVPPVLPSPHAALVRAGAAGRVGHIDGWSIAGLARLAGAPQDPSAGIDLLCAVGDVVEPGQPLYRIHASNATVLDEALTQAQGIAGAGIGLATVDGPANGL